MLDCRSTVNNPLPPTKGSILMVVILSSRLRFDRLESRTIPSGVSQHGEVQEPKPSIRGSTIIAS